MNLAELGALVDAAHHVRRLETLDAYASSSDVDWVQRYLDGDDPPDPSAKQGWLDRLRAAADRGHPRERLRVVSAPVPDYVRYSCEWGYIDNAAAGEIIRILDAAAVPELARDARKIGDVYMVDAQLVVMDYDEDGRFRSARHAAEDHGVIKAIDSLWSGADAFGAWWTMRPELHRDVHT